MPTYEYLAEQPDGTQVSGMVFGTSLDGVANELASKGMRVTRLGLAVDPNDPLAGVPVQRTRPNAPRPEVPRAQEVPVQESFYDYSAGAVEQQASRPITGPPVESRSYMATSVWGPLMGQVPLSALAFFFRQAATMIHAGVPMVQAINTLAGQSRSPKFQTILKEICGHVEAGRPMSAGMQRYPEVFSPVMMSLVRAGEEGGFLDRSLGTVADYLDQEIKLRNLYKRLTFFPKVQVVLSIIIIIAANMIIDSIKKDSQHLSSPLTTASTWVVLGPLIVGVFLFLRVGLANPRVKYNWDFLVSIVPYLGRTMRELAMARFGRAFGALYKSGVPMQQALKLSADACGNEYLRAKMYPAYRKLETGAGLESTLKETGAFSPIVLDMIHTGETTGSLDEMLGKMSDFYIGESEVRQTQIAYFVGALVGLGVAIYIGWIVINFYTGYGNGVTDMVNEAGK